MGGGGGRGEVKKRGGEGYAGVVSDDQAQIWKCVSRVCVDQWCQTVGPGKSSLT